MTQKYVFVTGGVVSGLGKGITAASIGRLLKSRGLRVAIQKLDPYLNVDPGTMNPFQHGEVFVTEDGAETDLDMGHYERFIDEMLTRESNVTSGRIYRTVILRERAGEYGGTTVQVIPHVTECIKEHIRGVAGPQGADVVIVEVGGTVGDIESQPFLEAIRQLAIENKRDNCIFVHLTLLPFVDASGEMKTKPTQHSVKQLQSLGIQPDVIVCRSRMPLSRQIKEKLSLFCNVPVENIIQNLDVPVLYEVPLALEAEGLANVICKRLGIPAREPDLEFWREMVNTIKNPEHSVEIALVGKYIALHDSYLSVVEALKHGGIPHRAEVKLRWVDSEYLNPETSAEMLAGVDGIIIPGGFGSRATDGMLEAVRYVRINRIPYFGICFGMQIATIEYARNVIGLKDAHSAELDPNTPYPVINLMPDQHGVVQFGATLRLGAYPCSLLPGSRAQAIYRSDIVHERHRHRYEFNNIYREQFREHGLVFCGTSPDNRIVEMIELPDHPWFIAVQFHPEFKSRPNNPHPLFASFIGSALHNQKR